MPDIHELIKRFNATAQSSGNIQADLHETCIRYRLISTTESIHSQDIYDIVNALSKMDLSKPTIIDLSSCKVVCSIDLSFIGFVINQSRYHKVKVDIQGATPIVARALTMVGFDKLCTLTPPSPDAYPY
jgi:hypothetical protein